MSEPSPTARPRIAVALGAPSQDAALAGLRYLAGRAELVELRLDLFREPYDLARLLAERPLPVLVTNRPPREGGRADAPDAERLAVLCRAAALGAEYVDVEWDVATPERIARLRAAGAGVVVSRHCFTELPADFDRWPDRLAASGADVIKVVGMATHPLDVLTVLRVLRHAALPTIAIAMGPAGLASRVLGLCYPRCFLTYASLDQSTATAPGQVSLDALRQVYRAGRLGPATAVYGVLGAAGLGPVEALNAALAAANRDAVAVPFPTGPDPVALLRAAALELPMVGWLVADPAAQASLGTWLGLAGPVNVVRFCAGEPVGTWAHSEAGAQETLLNWRAGA
jgi:3-dehydroquinate dehydratase/shikimate dehydrogenase